MLGLLPTIVRINPHRKSSRGALRCPAKPEKCDDKQRPAEAGEWQSHVFFNLRPFCGGLLGLSSFQKGVPPEINETSKDGADTNGEES